jgi:pimeloyl-ACP methyl ester carboxylesterase
VVGGDAEDLPFVAGSFDCVASAFGAMFAPRPEPAAAELAELLRSLELALKGPGFAAAFEAFQRSMGLDRVPEPLRSLVLAAQEVRPDVVLGYWHEVMRTDPEDMQARIEEITQRSDAPYLAVFGRALAPTERDYMVDRINGLQLDEWPGSGHFVHLADVERFTTLAPRSSNSAPQSNRARSARPAASRAGS